MALQTSGPRFSPSVLSALERLGDGPVEASAVLRELIRLHGEYGSGMAASLSLQDTGGESRTPDAWREAILSWLLERDYQGDLVHGRLIVLVLARIDPLLGTQLEESGFLRNVMEELGEMPGYSDSRFEPKPREATAPSDAQEEREPIPHQRAVGILDDDATKIDLLRRRPFAKYVASTLRTIRGDLDAEGRDGSFVLHIDGPWGSGKTTFLGFLRDELDPPDGTAPERWVVVNYNAWRHQHEDPPWWQLRDQVVRTVIDEAGTRRRRWLLRLSEWTWRFWVSVKPTALATAVVAALVAVVVIVAGRTSLFGLTGNMASGADLLTNISRFVVVFTALWGIAVAATRKLSPASQGGAQAFLESQRDPLGVLRKRFNRVVRSAGRPVAIFIDDLDRCSTSFVVGLIEGIQTLFRDTSIVYVVASDRRWVEASFDDHYSKLGTRVTEPGRSVGHLFLQKSFQVSVELPPITNAVSYWARLIARSPASTGEPASDGLEAERVRKELSKAKTPSDIDAQLERARSAEPDRYALWVIEALNRELDKDIRAETEHELRDFHPLLDRNPRVMKRFVNAYGIHRAAVLYSDALRGLPIEEPWKQLGLWTVIQMRWPAVAEALVSDPSLIQIARDEQSVPPDEEIDSPIRLLADPKVRQVVKADQVGVYLDERALRAFYGLPQAARPSVA